MTLDPQLTIIRTREAGAEFYDDVVGRIRRPGPNITPERYLASTKVANFPADWPEGMVIHVVGVFGSHLGVFDLWRSSADRSEFYGERITSAVTEATDIDPMVGDNPSAIELHSL